VAAGILDVDEARAEMGHEPRQDAPVLPAPAKLRAIRSRTIETKALDDLPGEFDALKDAQSRTGSRRSSSSWQAQLGGSMLGSRGPRHG
jgi:hypothetical protein